MLGEYVNHQGRVNYTGLQQNSADLDAYFSLISQYSPDATPSLFADEDARLAYWINAYNAAAMNIVLTYYPITSVDDISSPKALFFIPGKWRFFVFNHAQFGGVYTNLYYLENSLIRERFTDPRIHFALNCASVGCPHLPRYAFTGPLLDQQLDRETRKFFSQTRNFRIDHQQKLIFVSSILDWYQGDFIDWLAVNYPEKTNHHLLDYIALYVDAETAVTLAEMRENYSIEFLTYDWTLNDAKNYQ